MLELALFCCREEAGIPGRVESLAPPLTPLAFVIGGTGENLSLIGQFFSVGRDYSIEGLCFTPTHGAPRRSLCFPHFRVQPLDLSLPTGPRGGAVE